MSGFCGAWQIEDWARRIQRKPRPEDFEPLTWALYELGLKIKATDYLLAWQDLQKFSRELAQFFIRYDIWLTPAITRPPVPIGSFQPEAGRPLEMLKETRGFSPFTMIPSVAGRPSMSVPLFWNEEGLPIGSHFTGRCGDEATLFRLAAQLETARPWAQRRPVLAERPNVPENALNF